MSVNIHVAVRPTSVKRAVHFDIGVLAKFNVICVVFIYTWKKVKEHFKPYF